jgi:hypothetical protein
MAYSNFYLMGKYSWGSIGGVGHFIPNDWWMDHSQNIEMGFPSPGLPASANDVGLSPFVHLNNICESLRPGSSKNLVLDHELPNYSQNYSRASICL